MDEERSKKCLKIVVEHKVKVVHEHRFSIVGIVPIIHMISMCFGQFY